jgi:hypothetical protein
MFGIVLTACVPVFSCTADIWMILQDRETTGSASGRVTGEHESIRAANSLLLEERQSRHLLLLYILNVMLLFAFICVIKKKNDGMLSWLGRASVLISLINYYTIRYEFNKKIFNCKRK